MTGSAGVDHAGGQREPRLGAALAADRLTALAEPEYLLDWRFVLAFEGLHTAGVLAELPGDIAAITADLGLDADAVAACLQVLDAWGLVVRDGARVAWAEPRLRDEDLLVVAQHGVWIRRWAAGIGPRLHDRAADIPLDPPRLPPAVGLRLLERATSAAVADVIACCRPVLRRPGKTAPARVLDLGGGHGAYARAFAAVGAEVTIQDLPPVIEHLAADGRFADMRLVAQDMHVEITDGPFDLVLLGTVTNMFAPDVAADLLRRAAEQVAPGGAVAVLTHLRERGPVGAAFGVQMLTATPGGDAHGAEQYRSWFRDAGLVVGQVQHLTVPPLSICWGHAPASG